MDIKNLTQQLREQFPFRVELHAHSSPVSICSEVPPAQVAQIYKGLDFDGVCLTNHFVVDPARGTKQEYIDMFLKDFYDMPEAGDKLGLRVYLGAEIRFTENTNDYLIYGVDRKMLEEIYDLLPYGVVEFRKNYAMPESVFIQAHPMRNGCQAIDPALLDGVEAYNLHPNHNSRVGLSALFAKENGIPIVIAGSDFHHPNHKHEGLSAMLVREMPEDTYAIAKLLKEGDYLLELGRNNIMLP